MARSGNSQQEEWILRGTKSLFLVLKYFLPSSPSIADYWYIPEKLCSTLFHYLKWTQKLSLVYDLSQFSQYKLQKMAIYEVKSLNISGLRVELCKENKTQAQLGMITMLRALTSQPWMPLTQFSVVMDSLCTDSLGWNSAFS